MSDETNQEKHENGLHGWTPEGLSERTPVRSDTFVSRPMLRPDTAQDAPLAERRSPKRSELNLFFKAKDRLAAYSMDRFQAYLQEMEEGILPRDPEVAAVLREASVRLRQATAVANGKYRLVIEFSKEELEAIRF